jgi:hypothetical protein
MPNNLTLTLLLEKLSVCRLGNNEPVPQWAIKGNFFSITKTSDELSVVCPSDQVPAEIKAEAGWRAFKVLGPLDFALTGILASLAAPLAEAKISIFAISTFDTDYILVKEKDLNRASEVLSKLFIVANYDQHNS